MGSAQLDFVEPEESTAPPEAAVAQPSALRQQVAERLAAHKQRRKTLQIAEANAAQPEKPLSPKHRAAAAVAERFAHTPSYRAALAEQAKRAIQEAAAAAEIAMRNAEAVAAAQTELLGELELWNAPQQFTPETAVTIQSTPTPQPIRSAGITVRLYEDLPHVPPPVSFAPAQSEPAQSAAAQPAPMRPSAEELQALDAEIAFRKAPVFEDYLLESEPHTLLDTNLLEFPRQLVATRKARPRLAEGPLREDLTPRTAQLRIFEVEPEQIATAPLSTPAEPEWAAMIHLDAHKVTQPETVAEASPMPVLASLLPPQTAPLGLRSMAAAVDAILVAGCALACIAIYAKLGGEIVLGPPAAIEAAGLLVVLHIIYQLLFFTFSDQTPGMRYARIGLCTFADDNPTRSAMRKRILAQFVAVCPLGLGVLWIFLDDDGLGWHDRISRMYQRAY